MTRQIKISSLEEKQQIIEFLNSGTYPEDIDKDKERRRRFRSKSANFIVRNGSIYYKAEDGSELLAIFAFETELVATILDAEHRSGHPGINRMVDLIHRKYYGIPTTMITNFVKSCESCNNFNSFRTVSDIHVNQITRKYDRYIMDCVDLRHYSELNDGYCWILNVIDTFTKYLFSFKLKNKTAQSVKESLEFIYDNFGVPVSIQADNGKEFSNQLLRDFHNALNIRIVHGRPRNPRAQGQVERANQTLKRWLAKTCQENNSMRWIDFHAKIVKTYNTTKHRATNVSPFFLFHGQSGFNTAVIEEIEGESDADDTSILEEYSQWHLESEAQSRNIESLNASALEHFEHYRNAMIAQANPNTPSNTVEAGDRVMLRMDFDNNTQNRRRPFDSFFERDRFIVLRLLNNNMVRILNESTGEIINVFKNRLRKCDN
jgi:transposase InsO family protein